MIRATHLCFLGTTECCAPLLTLQECCVVYIRVATVLLVLRALFYADHRWGEDGCNVATNVVWQFSRLLPFGSIVVVVVAAGENNHILNCAVSALGSFNL